MMSKPASTRTDRICDTVSLWIIAIGGAGLLCQMLLGTGGAQ